MAFMHLSEATLNQVRAAVQDLGLNTDGNLGALNAGISPAFVGSFMVGRNPNAKLLTLTARMNETPRLVSGQVPLEIWLKNAILLAGGTKQELVFREALAEMSVDGRSARLSSGLAATPRGAGGKLEIAIDEDDTLGVRFLLLGAEAARSVAKVLVHRHFGGQPAFVAGGEPAFEKGTGWLIGPRLMITNHHVVTARQPSEEPPSDADFGLQGRNCRVIFDFLDEASAGVTTSSTSCVLSDETLDYALLRLDQVAPERPSLRLRKNPLTRPPGSALRERVNVLQHPQGRAMRLGFRNNFVVTGDAHRISYLTDTAGGSSGSPIFDDLWFVAGLHRGFAPITGGPVEVWGKQITQENFGAPIGKILADIGTKDPALRAEIEASQP